MVKQLIYFIELLTVLHITSRCLEVTKCYVNNLSFTEAMYSDINFVGLSHFI